MKSVGKKEDSNRKSTRFIICNIFLERYATAGVLTILPLFLHNKMDLDKNLSMSIFHFYEGMMLLFTIFGAILADVWLGLYKSIILMTCVYIFGLLIVSLSMIDAFDLPVSILVTLGMVIMVIGSGCIKSNTNVFGGNQYKLPEEQQQMQLYFSIQYFALKFGGLIARITLPIFREDVQCLGQDDCYSLTFGVPASAMVLALCVLLMGHFRYKHVGTNENVLIKVIKCIKHALQQKWMYRNSRKHIKQHWLDYAAETYSRNFIYEIKIAFKVLVIYFTVPMFWALHMQQCSQWIFQAAKMNGDIGFYTIKPDQIVVLNSILVLILIPISEKYLYSILEKFGIKSMLHRMILGFVCTIISFIISAVVEAQVEKNSLSILWQLPQFFFMSMAEVLAYLGHLNFAYTEAPTSMKPVMVAFMYLSTASGGFIVALISGISIFTSQTCEYIFYAFLMVIDTGIMGVLAQNYKFIDHDIARTNEGEEGRAFNVENDQTLIK